MRIRGQGPGVEAELDSAKGQVPEVRPTYSVDHLMEKYPEKERRQKQKRLDGGGDLGSRRRFR